MKSVHTVLLPAVVLAVAITPNCSHAQTASPPLSAASTAKAPLPSPTPYAVTKQDGNSRVWERTMYELGPNGQVIPKKHSYTELATGLNYQKNGQWTASKEEIDVLPQGGAAAIQGQHQVYFPGNINTGVIKVVTPDGKPMQSRPLAIFYDDGSKTVALAVLTNSVGLLVGSNQVIYPNAFSGLKADLRYTYKKSGFEQDIVLQQQPHPPEYYGLDPAKTHLQLLTEFVGTADPVQTASKTNRLNGLSDTTLAFGKMRMVQGKAFTINSESGQRKTKTSSSPVYKSWQHIAGRTFLVEELPVKAIAAQLQQLPMTANADTASPADSILQRVSPLRLLPTTRLADADAKPVLIAKADVSYKSGVVLDFYLTEYGDQSSPFTFLAGTTYYISDAFNLYDTTTFQGTAVIKEDELFGTISIFGTVNNASDPADPVIFTSMNDDSVGQQITGSNGSPDLGLNNMINVFTDSIELDNFQINYSDLAFYSYNADTISTFWNCEFNNCQWANICVDSGTVVLRNVLNPTVFFYDDDGDYTLDAQQVTSVGGGVFVSGASGSYTWIIKNSIIMGEDGDWESTTYWEDVATSGVDFASDGVNNYYLSAGSSYRNAGATDIDGGLLSELQILTTYAPQDGSYPDTDTPDLGYHYPILSPPTANDDPSETSCPDGSDDIYLNNYASDLYGQPLTYAIVTSPTHGTLSDAGSGNYIYTPTGCYKGTDSFTFKVNDGHSDSGTATVTITIGVTVSTSYSTSNSSFPAQTCKNSPLGIMLNASDSPCSSTFSYTILASPASGVLLGTAPNLTYSNTSPTFTGVDSFTYKVSTGCGDAATNTVTITVGDSNITANPQAAMTGTNQPLSLTLTASDTSDSCVAGSFTYTITASPTNGTLTGTGANRTYTPNLNYEGVDHFTFAASDGGWSSTNTVTIFVVAGPTNFMAQCASNGPGIMLNWGLDGIVQDMEVDDGLAINDFQIYRRTSPGVFTTNDIIYTTPDSTQTNYLDVTVIPGTTYYYAVAFTYQDPNTGIIYESPYAKTNHTACLPPSLGTNGVDVAFIIDNTGSMGDIISAIQDAIDNTLDYITNSSGGNYRLALVTPDDDEVSHSYHDMVDVRVSFSQTNRVAFENEVNALFADGGGNAPESTDQCLNTVVNALLAAGRTNDDSCTTPASPLLQTNNFSPAFRTNAVKLVVLITDAPPSGFCDGAGGYTTNNAHLYALEASTNHIQINAIQISTVSTTTSVMEDYATTSCGWYSQLDYSSSSGDIETDILNMIHIPDECH